MAVPFAKLSKKYQQLKDQFDKLKKKLESRFKDELDNRLNQLIGNSFLQYVEHIVGQIRGRPGPQRASLKLLDLSTCSGECSAEPAVSLAFSAPYKLFLLYSELSHAGPYFFPENGYADSDHAQPGVEAPITFDPGWWIPRQCAQFGCGPQVQQ